MSCIARLSSKLDALSIGPLTDSGLLTFATISFPRLMRLRISLSMPRRPDRQRIKDIMENCPMVSSMHVLWGVRQYAYGQVFHLPRYSFPAYDERNVAFHNLTSFTLCRPQSGRITSPDPLLENAKTSTLPWSEALSFSYTTLCPSRVDTERPRKAIAFFSKR